MILRRRTYEKASPSRDAQKIYIICEGQEREKDYFEFFEGISSNLELITIPPENGTDPVKLMEQAIRTFLSDTPVYQIDESEGDLVWFVIDTDTWMEEGKILILKDFCNVQNDGKRYEIWNIAQSNPCLETWLYYHVYSEKPDHKEVSEYVSMKEFVNAKISGGFNCEVHPMYIKDAIVNSENNYSDTDGYPDLYSTQMHYLGKAILKYAKHELERKLRRVIQR